MFKVTVLALLPAALAVACGEPPEDALCPERGTGALETGSLFDEVNNAWMVESPGGALVFISEEGPDCELQSDGTYVRIDLCEAAAGTYSIVELPTSFDGCPEALLRLNWGAFSFTRASGGTVTVDSLDESCARGRFDTMLPELIHELSGSFQATVCEPCGPAGSQSCDGDVLETCTEEGFIRRETCEFGCMAGRCNECTPSTTECRQKIPNHWDELVTCDAGGAIERKADCPLGCNEEPDPDACFVLEPSNLPAGTCDTPGETDVIVSADTVIDTDGSCPGGVVEQGPGLPEICVFKYASYEVQSGVTVRATGSRALAIVATEVMSIGGTIDVSANGPVSGPGALPSNFGGGGSGGSLADGGGGAGHGREGGDGGAHGGAGSAAGAGGVSTGNEALIPLVGGSRGGNAGAAAGGGGGGALQLVSCGTLDVSGVLHAGGGGGQGGPGTDGQSSPNGGAGGGAGGAILIEVPLVESSYYMLATGGGGGAGGLASGAEGTPGEGGEDATPAPGEYVAAPGGEGVLDQGSGGKGGLAVWQPPTPGETPGSAAGGAGGGGGGVGRIRLNAEDISVGGGRPYASGGNVARH